MRQFHILGSHVLCTCVASEGARTFLATTRHPWPLAHCRFTHSRVYARRETWGRVLLAGGGRLSVHITAWVITQTVLDRRHARNTLDMGHKKDIGHALHTRHTRGIAHTLGIAQLRKFLMLVRKSSPNAWTNNHQEVQNRGTSEMSSREG